MQSLSSVTLIGSHRKEALDEKGQALLTSVLTSANVCTDKKIKLLMPYVAPLMNLAELTQGLGPNITTKIEFDKCSQFSNISEHIIKDDGTTTTEQALLVHLYNGYVNENYERTPLLAENGIAVKKDTKSFLIHAADVFGNFCMNLMFAKLRHSSKKKNTKAAIISKVYSDRMDLIDFSEFVTFDGDDLVLAHNKEAIIHRAGWTIVQST